VADLGCIAASTRPPLVNFTLGRPWSLLRGVGAAVSWEKIGGDLIEGGAWRPR
jgi:hypothetical protein